MEYEVNGIEFYPALYAGCPSGASENSPVLHAHKDYPKGTLVLVMIPLCPECEEDAPMGTDLCTCGFDWGPWRRESLCEDVPDIDDGEVEGEDLPEPPQPL